MYKVTKEFSFECSHRLENHPAGCFNNHGHSYKLFITVACDQLDEGSMVIDFQKLTSIINPVVKQFDHSYVYDCTTEDIITKDIVDVFKKHGLCITPIKGRVTAENMCKYFYDIVVQGLCPFMEGRSFRVSVKLYETAKSYAEYSED